MNNAKIRIQTHRFRDSVAVCLTVEDFNGKRHTIPTIYLDAKDARKLTRGINKAAKSVETCGFANSPNVTTSHEFNGKA